MAGVYCGRSAIRSGGTNLQKTADSFKKGDRLLLADTLGQMLPRYELHPVGEETFFDLFQLEESNAHYFAYEQDHPLTYEEAIEDIMKMPPELSPQQKQVFGLYRDGRMLAVADWAEGYPEADIVWIGLFMVDAGCARQGIGREVIETFCRAARENQFKKIRLGCIAENVEGLAFWQAMGFVPIDRVHRENPGKRPWELIFMQRELS